MADFFPVWNKSPDRTWRGGCSRCLQEGSFLIGMPLYKCGLACSY